MVAAAAPYISPPLPFPALSPRAPMKTATALVSAQCPQLESGHFLVPMASYAVSEKMW